MTISPFPFLPQELRFIIQVKWICTIKFNNFCYSCRIIKNCTLFCYLLPAINWLGWKYRVILMLIIVTRRYIEPLRFAVYEYSYTANVYFVFIIIMKIFTHYDSDITNFKLASILLNFARGKFCVFE